MNSIKIDISIIVPIYNVEGYLYECLTSLKNQSFFTSIEFICINDGSTDNSNNILREYEADDRFVVMDKVNEGYGKTMNRGLNMARGKYIGFLESDDFADSDAYKKLYDAIEETGADFVKGNFRTLINNTVREESLYRDDLYDKVINPKAYPEFLYEYTAIWSGLYRRDFLISNNIRFNETPGASYQDTSFLFQVWFHAKKIFLIKDSLINYRRDNECSSVNSKGKVFCLCDEFKKIENVLEENKADLSIYQTETVMKFKKYEWNLKRLAECYKDEFKNQMEKELFFAEQRGYIDRCRYSESEYDRLNSYLWEYARRTHEGNGNELSRQLERQLSQGILAWYKFKEKANVLYLGASGDSLFDLLKTRKLEVETDTWEHICDCKYNDIDEKQYDYMLLSYDEKKQEESERILKYLKGRLNPEGVLFIYANNPLGISMMCGDWVPEDSVYNVDPADIEECLKMQKIYFQRFSVFPRKNEAIHLYRDGYIPAEDLSNRIMPSYYHPDSVFASERRLYDRYLKNDIFHQHANAYLYICSLRAECLSNALQITTSMERSRENAMVTTLFEDEHVEKRAAFIEGEYRIDAIKLYEEQLRERGIRIVPMQINNGVLSMPFRKAKTGAAALRDVLLAGDISKFLEMTDAFRELIYKSSDSEIVEGIGKVLKNGYFDLIPINSFYDEEGFEIFDQEFCFSDYPADVIVSRMIESIYSADKRLMDAFPQEKLYERYGILQDRSRLMRRAARDLAVIRNEAELRDYHLKTRADVNVVVENAFRNQFGCREQKKVFDELFDDIIGKKIFLFGSGKYAQRFIERYGNVIRVEGIVDNNNEKWGQKLQEITIINPEEMPDKQIDNIKVIICIKDFEAPYRQLCRRGIRNIGIFNPSRTYFIPEEMKNVNKVISNDKGFSDGKKYGIGYLAGVFDMFHVGHLNVIRRAKEHCNHLIVGVCSDEWVRNTKKTEPIMSFEERIELVRACRYVDEAVRIPPEAPSTWDAFQRYHFDVQFSGSDYEHNPGWLRAKEYLEKNGSTMVFFPYTESTSSSKLKEMISKRLI
ncbi:glycosyltransferase [Butyrivibrio sp. XPD2002]|uniref:glycosyltransferase n=1 Tax=Butyrivibrio sp. XPD2002 TaxID=1280665 RepID=UPI00042715E3|nr:glycosyltransferase [Butyrivibrio sp. XPD2002]